MPRGYSQAADSAVRETKVNPLVKAREALAGCIRAMEQQGSMRDVTELHHARVVHAELAADVAHATDLQS